MCGCCPTLAQREMGASILGKYDSAPEGTMSGKSEGRGR